MNVFNALPFVPVGEEQNSVLRDRRDAQIKLRQDGKSDRFIAVRLIEMYAPEWRERFGPVKNIRVMRQRIGVAGNKVVIEVKIVDEYICFDWDSQVGQHIAYLYDDDEGYNKSLLARHFYNDQYEIMDENTRFDIQKIAEEMKKTDKPIVKEDAPVLTEEEAAKMSAETIDNEIAFNEKRLQALKEQKKKIIAEKPAAKEPTGNESKEPPARKPLEHKRIPKKKGSPLIKV